MCVSPEMESCRFTLVIQQQRNVCTIVLHADQCFKIFHIHFNYSNILTLLYVTFIINIILVGLDENVPFSSISTRKSQAVVRLKNIEILGSKQKLPLRFKFPFLILERFSYHGSCITN